MLAPKRAEPRRNSRHGAGAGPDGVVDELGAEGHLELDELEVTRLRTEPRDGAEAVEVANEAARNVVHDRVAATEKARHHGRGHARGETGGDSCVRCAAARREDLEPGGYRSRVARGDSGWKALAHEPARGRATQATRATPARGESHRQVMRVASVLSR